MNTPFIYGVAAEEMYFTDRENETKRLLMNFENGLNTILISPRRWGKTSLVNKVAEQMKTNPQIRVVRMDAFSVRTPEDFYRMFATEIIKQTSSRVEESLTKEGIDRGGRQKYLFLRSYLHSLASSKHTVIYIIFNTPEKMVR